MVRVLLFSGSTRTCVELLAIIHAEPEMCWHTQRTSQPALGRLLIELDGTAVESEKAALEDTDRFPPNTAHWKTAG